jgi:hypothetical protein
MLERAGPMAQAGAAHGPGRRARRFFLGANRSVVPKPIDEANRCNLRHVAPRTLQKALYVGFSQIGRPLRVVCLGWSHFLSQKRASQGRSHYILATVHRSLTNGHICTPISAFYFLLLP